jgi:hypothetical protein
MTTKKMALIAQARLTPMLCVGETLEEREAGRTAEVVDRQLSAGLAELDEGQVSAIMLAYEPVWAIGTGRTATPEDASEIHGVLRRALVSRVGEKAATGIPILYGGSVNRGNASQLLAAIFPGTSRSGATILAGMFCGLSRTAATDFSFLLGIPTLFAACGLSFYRQLKSAGVPGQEEWLHLGLGFAVSAVTAYFVVRWLIGYVRTNTFIPFAWYRIGLGLIWLLFVG